MTPLLLLALAAPALAATPGEVRTYSTIRSIGVEWDVSGDDDTDAAVAVRYRRAGTTAWSEAMPLVRTRANGDLLAGSILFLRPGTPWEVELSFSDSDGTTDTRTETVSTRPVPTKPTQGRTFHVSPGAAGGDGSEGAPFGSIDEAEAVARPGDTFLLHAGDYGVEPTFDGGGDASAYVVWQAAGDGEVRLTGARVRADHLWLEGLTVVDREFAMVTDDDPVDVVVARNTFLNNHNAIVINDPGASGWTIMDNTIVGDNVVSEGSFSGEGVLLGETHDHVVMYNAISNVADGVSYPGRNCDIYGNDIRDTSDDGIEADLGLANVRMWGNRIHNAYHNAITFQPQIGAPWYIIRNQVAGSDESIFKFREGVDRNIIVHNTFVQWDWVVTNQGYDLMKSLSRNNLYISVQGGKIFDFADGTADARTDLDHDGFDWAGFQYPFKYAGSQHVDLASFTAASGQEVHGVVLDAAACLPTLDVPAAPPASVPAQHMALAAGCPAIDAGAVLPNLAEDYEGSAPDIGAYELGADLPHYGPRIDAGDWEDTGSADTDVPDTGDDTDGGAPDDDGGSGCGCASTGAGGLAWVVGLAGIGWMRGRVAGPWNAIAPPGGERYARGRRERT